MGWQEEYNALKKRRATAKGKLTRKVTLLEEGVDRGDHLSALKCYYEGVLEAFQCLESRNDAIIDFVGENSLEEQLEEEAQQYMLESERVKNKAQALMCKVENEQNSSCKPKVKVKAFEPPKFDGNVRDYPNFKDDFQNLVKNVYGADPYALKMCLSGDALQTVRGAEGSYDEMFERLDDKYGNARKIVDLVISDLKCLRKIADGDTESFIKMVDQVDQCWLDLKKVNLSDELNTANVVSHIEKVLPSLQKREWVMVAGGVSTTSQLFPELLKFLKKEKKVLEYMNSSVRNSTGDKVLVHSVNHTIEGGADAELLSLVRKMNEEQRAKNKEFESCIVSLTEIVKGTNIKTENSNGSCWLHNNASHDITDCYKFKTMNSKNRYEIAKNYGICFRCLRGYHAARNCKAGKLCGVMVDGQGPCNRNHHSLLHSDQREGTLHNAISGKACTALLNISVIYSRDQPLNVLWDSGSDVSLITHKMAKKLGLKGKDINLSMIKVGNVVEHQSSKEYCVPLMDKTGKVWNVDVVGIHEISTSIKEVDISRVPQIFTGISEPDVYRPSGKIDILIGTNYSELLPRVIQTHNGLQLLENQFGLSIRGRHREIATSVNTSHNIVVRTHKLSAVPLNEISVESQDSLKDQLDRFFTIEDRGIECDKECVKCLCRGCPALEFVNSKEEKELALIENGLTYDDNQRCWVASYPWIQDPNQLTNNVKVAFARLKTTENRLRRLDIEYARKYQNEIEDMVRRGIARKLSDREIRDYKGPVHYIHHHEVLKPESSSTPLRIVFNSSASYMGQRLNEFWAKGPNILNNLLGVLLRFRQEKIAIAGDISKMYHTIKISLLDQHTHRFLWRDLDSSSPPDHYVLTSVTFGDRPSGVIATSALRQTVHKFGSEFPEVKDMIMRNTYVDDVLHSTDSVDRAFNLTRDADEILSLGGFHVKYWVISGCHESRDVNVVESDCEKVLGLKWKPKEDYFFFTVNLNFSPRIRKIRSGPKLQRCDVEAKFPKVLTRRMILSQIASFYDPLGFAVPVILQAKIMMRSMITRSHSGDKEIEWDDPLDTAMVNKWKQFFVDLYELEKLTFQRTLKPSNAMGRPSLIIFSDGSMQAYGACAYVRWQTTENKFVASLIVAKNKIAPLKQLSIPRLELCGALVAARLRETIVKQFDWNFQSVIHIVDSSIVRSQIQKESRGFNTFVAVRIAEIQTKTDPREWWWIDSSMNIADLTSRPCSPKDIGENSSWQNGPKFLTYPVSEWPIRQTCEEQIPDKTGIIMTIAKNKEKAAKFSMIVVERFSDYSKLLRVTCRVRAVFKCKSLKGMFKEPTVEDVKEAELMWVKEMQGDMTDWEVRFKRLGPKLNDGVITVGERISKWLKENWNQESFILLPDSHPVTKLYISCLHKRDHAGIETTLAKLQSKFWVPGARKVIKKIKENCIVCRKLAKRIEDQCMGQVRAERLKPAPPFYHTAVDLFGPFTIKDTVKRRTRSKAYGVIFNCLVTRAVYLDLAEGYNTEDFLTTFQRFIAIRGAPKFMYSDKGTQLMSASKRLKNIGREEGVTWSFNRPSDAPWYNGASESLIKSVKRCLCITIGESILTFGDLQTAMFSVSNMINERPIGVKPAFNLELGSYLCPNDLLLGRSSNHCPSGIYEINDDFKRRLAFVQGIVDSFWRKWQRDYFSTLLCRQKWHTTRRNVKVGDIVLVQDSNTVRGAWKIAQIIKAKQGCDGNVREVDLRYKIIKDGKGYDGVIDKIMSRSVHRLVVLLPVEEQV